MGNAKSIGLVLLLGVSIPMAAQSRFGGPASSPSGQARFTQSSPAPNFVATTYSHYSSESGTLPESQCIVNTGFVYLGTVMSRDRVHEHSNELVIPSERVQELPGERVQAMPRVGED